jgi:hypothetical protein
MTRSARSSSGGGPAFSTGGIVGLRSMAGVVVSETTVKGHVGRPGLPIEVDARCWSPAKYLVSSAHAGYS